MGGVEAGAETGAGAEEEGSDGGWGAAEDEGDFGGGEVVDGGEEEGVALGWGEAVEFGEDGLDLLGLGEDEVGGEGLGGEGLGELGVELVGADAAAAVEGKAPADADEPGAEVADVGEGVPVFEDAEEGVLDDVFGFGGVAEDGVGDAEEEGGVGVDEAGDVVGGVGLRVCAGDGTEDQGALLDERHTGTSPSHLDRRGRWGLRSEEFLGGGRAGDGFRSR